MKHRAFCFIRDLPHYRREAFVSGLRAERFDVVYSAAAQFRVGDVVVIWNRYGTSATYATAAERAGATIIVAENGFVGRDADGHQFYQLALGAHNGAGVWHVGDDDRLAALGITVAAQWTQDPGPQGHIVVRGQRGIGPPGLASPPDWHNIAARRLAKLTARRVVVVPHPGQKAVDDTAHVEYLRGAYALVVWASSVGVKALVAGVPVIADSPFWVCKDAAAGISDINSDLRTEASNAARLASLSRMAWAQWSLDEIASGMPFRLLLDAHNVGRVAEAVA